MKRKLIIATLALVTLAGLSAVATFILKDPAEPVYQGKPLSFWLRGQFDRKWLVAQEQKSLRDKTAPRIRLEFEHMIGGQPGSAHAALNESGTNAIPTLLRLLQAKDSARHLKLVSIGERLPLVHYSHWRAESRNQAGRFGFKLLGEEASNAVPELAKILDRNISADSARATAESLQFIGPAAAEAVPALLRQLSNTNEFVREAVAWALCHIHVNPELVVPALVKELDHPYVQTPSPICRALASWGSAAAPAVPKLVDKLSSANAEERSIAKYALMAIDPAALEQARKEGKVRPR